MKRSIVCLLAIVLMAAATAPAQEDATSKIKLADCPAAVQATYKGDGSPAVQQLDRSVHLGRPDLEFGGNLQKNFVQNGSVRKVR